MAKLDRYWDGKWAATLVLEERDYVVGRGTGCDMLLTDPLASRRHFALRWQPEGYYLLEDLDTPNGTIVDGVKESRYRLVQDTTIQVGQEFLFFYPDEYSAGPSSPDLQSALARRQTEADEFTPVKTAYIHPADLARLQADVRARQAPHLLRRRRQEISVFSLKDPVTLVGFGPVDASLGPSRGGKPRVLAEVHRLPDGRFKIKAKGLFRKILVNDQPTRARVLEGGERLNVGGVILEFHTGLEKNGEYHTNGA